MRGCPGLGRARPERPLAGRCARLQVDMHQVPVARPLPPATDGMTDSGSPRTSESGLVRSPDSVALPGRRDHVALSSTTSTCQAAQGFLPSKRVGRQCTCLLARSGNGGGRGPFPDRRRSRSRLGTPWSAARIGSPEGVADSNDQPGRSWRTCADKRDCRRSSRREPDESTLAILIAGSWG